jgi:predicted membrane-bound spermidine synthase
MNKLKQQPIHILLTIFLAGFVGISSEIFTIRQLIPLVGTGIIVTSMIIGMFLLFLALGYWRGGNYQDNFIVILQRNFMLAAILLGVGISYTFISAFFSTIEHYLPYNNLLLTLTIYLLLIIAPTIYLIGQTIPLTMNLIDPQQRTAKIGGEVLFINTLGSFLGALLTSLLLLEHLGVAWTVFINFAILIMLGLICSTLKELPFYSLLAAGMLWLVYDLNISVEKKYFIATTNYANYSISKETSLYSEIQGKTLVYNNSRASFLDQNNTAFPYIELIKRILFKELKLQHAQILVLGAGGFTISAANTYNNEFTYVDIDPKIKTIVEENFLPKINGKFIAQDARTYLPKHPQQYDVIISDTYSNSLTIPAMLLTQEHFSNIKKALKHGGLAIFNIIANPLFKDAYTKRVDSTIRAVFSNCLAIPLHYANHPTNIIYLCNTNDNDTTIYTDNHNTADLDVIFSKAK